MVIAFHLGLCRRLFSYGNDNDGNDSRLSVVPPTSKLSLSLSLCVADTQNLTEKQKKDDRTVFAGHLQSSESSLDGVEIKPLVSSTFHISCF